MPAKPAPAKVVRTPKPATQPPPLPLTQPQVAQAPKPQPAKPAAAPCRNCGVIDAVRAIEKKGEGSGLGAVAGGVLGGVLGHQVGSGRGNDLATIAGAVGGALAGHEIEKNTKKGFTYQIVVLYEDGTTGLFSQDTAPTWQPGDKVRVENGVIMAR
jgi:outer membrane lipoprotein SlyB